MNSDFLYELRVAVTLSLAVLIVLHLQAAARDAYACVASHILDPIVIAAGKIGEKLPTSVLGAITAKTIRLPQATHCAHIIPEFLNCFGTSKTRKASRTILRILLCL